jgi:putative hemolysin
MIGIFASINNQEMEKKMKKFPMLFITIGVFLCTTLTSCTPGIQAPGSIATDIPQANMPNPASLYCEQNGNTLEIQTAADGSQSGVCVFPDGATCDEWAYYRGECGPVAQTSPTPIVTIETTQDASGGYMPPGTSEEISDWWGVIKSTPSGAQFDDYFERQDLGQMIYFGIDSMDPAIQGQIKELRDSSKIVHLYGMLFSNVPDYNGSQVQVDRIEVEE